MANATADQLVDAPEMASLDDTVRRMQREILHDVVAGIVPRTARSFAELGSSRDLSVYGGFSEMRSQGQLSEALTVYMQKAQDHVDVWLFYGGLEKEGLPPGWKPASNETKYQFDPWGLKSQDPIYELAVRAEGVPTLDLMVLQDGEKFIGVHGTVKMDAFDSPKDAAEQASLWGVQNGWGEEIMHQALWPEVTKGLKGGQLLFSVGTGDGWNCHTSDGMGIRIDPVGGGAAWDWSASRGWMVSCGTGQAPTREEAIDAAVGTLLAAGISVDALPSEVFERPKPTPLQSTATGRIWWSAENLAEAQKWQSDLTAKGASVELRPESDREVVDVIITLERARANEILGYEVDAEEWLLEDDPVAHAVAVEANAPPLDLSKDVPQKNQIQPVGNDHEGLFLHHEIYIKPSKDGHRGGFDWSVCRNGVELDAGQEFSVDVALNRAKGVVTAKFDELTASAAKQAGAAYTFCQVASEMLSVAQGDVAAVDWDAFNKEVIQRSILQNKQPFMRVAEVLLEFSPGAITDEQQGAILLAVRKAAQQLEAGEMASCERGLAR